MSTELFSVDELVNLEGLERNTNPISNKVNLTLGVINAKELNKLVSFIKALKLKVKIDVVKETLVSTHVSKINNALDLIDSTVYSTLANPEFIRQFFFNESKMEHLDKLMDDLDFLEEQAYLEPDESEKNAASLEDQAQHVITNDDLLKNIVVVPNNNTANNVEATKPEENEELMINFEGDIEGDDDDSQEPDITILEEPKMLTVCYVKYDSLQTYVEANTNSDIKIFYDQLQSVITSL
jgi:hypothetical protein